MSGAREIVTFQFGNYANFIGAHWWNIQESSFSYDSQEQCQPSEISHDVLYREGLNLNRQVTYTPRLLLVDLDGSLKHLPREGELYGNSIKRTTTSHEKLKEQLPWPMESGVEVVEQPEASKSEFQKDLENPAVNINEKEYDLAANVDSWADFLFARYHPRTVQLVQEHKQQPDKETFVTYCAGVQLWKSERFEEEFCDKIRQYVEECDYLQGFQTIFDCFNGHSGLATQCLQHLNEEYGKASFVLPVYAPQVKHFENANEAMMDSIRIVNSALTFNQLTEQASLFLPLSTQERVWRQLGGARSLRSLHYQPENLYQTSAILAAYLDTLTLRYRLKDAPSASSLAGFCGDLTNYGRKMAAAAFAMPFPMQHEQDLIDCLDQFEGEFLTQLTPNCTVGTAYVTQSLCVRGIPSARLKRPLEHAQLQMRMAAYKCQSVSEMFQLYLQCANHNSLAHVSSIESAMRTRLPFPGEMFDASLSTTGFLTANGERNAHEKVSSVPTLAAIQSSSALGDTLETLHREAKRIKIAKLHHFNMAGMEEDEYAEALECLQNFKDNYEDNFEL